MVRKTSITAAAWLAELQIPIFHAQSHGAALNALSRAVGLLLQFANQHHTDCAVAVGVRGVIGPRSALDRVLPPGAAASLSHGRVLLNKVSVRLITKRIRPLSFGQGSRFGAVPRTETPERVVRGGQNHGVNLRSVDATTIVNIPLHRVEIPTALAFDVGGLRCQFSCHDASN